MGFLCSIFDVKKQGKPIREVRTRYWKLREGENRLSGLLEAPLTKHSSLRSFSNNAYRYLGEGKKARGIKYNFCSSTIFVVMVVLISNGEGMPYLGAC
ncbi:hypothetical protein GQ457_02G020650 [Hibiscus cannabinus]